MTAAIAGPCDAALARAALPRTNPHSGATLAATILGSSVALIDGSVLNVALPALARDLGAGPAELSWTVNAYLLPLGALTLLGGAAGDHFGRRLLFLIGLALFTLASVLCAVAPTLAWLLAARGAQGLGAAILMPNSLAILGAAFAGEARGRAVGIWAASGALAGALGPLLGGWLVDASSWRMVFLLNLPTAAVAAYLAWNFVAETKERRGPVSLDWTGSLLATVALALLTWALTAASEATTLPALLWSAAGAGLAMLIAFVRLEAQRGDQAIMPLAMFATPTFIGLTVFTFLLYAVLGGIFVLLPYMLIQIGGYSAVAAGAAMLPLPIVIGLGSALMGRLAGESGSRLPLALGAVLVALGMALYLRVGEGRVDYWTDIFPPTLLLAIGMGVSVAPLTTSVMASVDADHVGAAAGFNSAVARIGSLVATALLGFVFARQGSSDAFLTGFRVAALVGAASAAVAALCALVLIRPVEVRTS